MPKIIPNFLPFALSAVLISLCFTLSSCSKAHETISSCDNSTQIQVCFSPGQNCTQMLVDTINASQHNIYVQAYSFTSYPIAKALVHAADRGVSVTVIVDKSDVDPSHFSVLPYLKQHNISISIDNQVNIAHNKVMIFDNTAVETGSFNFTNAAQNLNAENMLIIHNSEVAKAYLQNWQQRETVSQKL